MYKYYMFTYMKILLNWDVAQRYSTCLTCARLQVQSPAL